jgi:4-hydroxy-2-oxoheptanedioate aldolase
VRAERLLAALADGGVALGTTLHLSDPAVVEAAGIAGYDWLSVVLEHSPLTMGELRALQLAADLYGVTTLAHVPTPEDPRLLQALNLGAGGIVCSHVSDRETAERLVHASRFPPLGDRGAHGSVRSAGYGSQGYDEYVATTDQSVAVGVVLEDPLAIEQAEEILSVPGLTLAFVGLADLAQSMGTDRSGSRDDLIAAITHVVGIADERGLAIGMSPYGFTPIELRKLGGRMLVSPATDYSMVMDGFQSHATAFRSELEAASEG